MGICSSYASLWQRAVVAMLAISLASSEVSNSCDNGADVQCYPSSGHPEIPDQTAEDLVLQAQCLSACIAELDAFCNCDYTVEHNFREAFWPYLKLSQLAEEDCSVYQKLLDCQRGCFIHAKDESLPWRKCRDACTQECSDRCSGTCEDQTYEGSECILKCRGSTCSYGCKLNIPSNVTESDIPASPVYPPVLTPVGSSTAGQYRFDTGTQGQQELIGSAEEIKPLVYMHTSFILKVENLSAIYFQLVSDGVVDLEFLACQYVSVSFAPVNINGLSQYSPVTGVCIFGETRYPEQVNQQIVTYTIEEDFTMYKNAIVTINWNPPEGLEYLTHYKIEFFSLSCWQDSHPLVVDDNVDRLATNYTLRPTSEYSLEFGCKLYFRITCEPSNILPKDIIQKMIVLNQVTTLTPALILDCESRYNTDGTINIVAAWKIPDEAENWLTETIAHFLVRPSLIDTGHDVFVDHYSDIFVDNNKELNSTHVAVLYNLDPQRDTDYKYRMRVDSIKNTTYFWRLTPDFVQCFFDAFQKGPIPINASNVVVSGLVFTDSVLVLNATWDPPTIVYGNMVDRYEIRIGQNVLGPLEEYNQYDFIKYESMNNIFVNTTRIFQIERVTCLYLQIRSYNEYQMSEWSQPVMLAKYPLLDPMCIGLIPTNPSTNPSIVNGKLPPSESPQSSDESISSYLFVVVAASFIGVLLLFILVSVATLLCCRYRCRKLYQKAFKPTKPIESDSLGYALAMRQGNTSNIPEPVKNAYVETPIFNMPTKLDSQD